MITCMGIGLIGNWIISIPIAGILILKYPRSHRLGRKGGGYRYYNGKNEQYLFHFDNGYLFLKHIVMKKFVRIDIGHVVCVIVKGSGSTPRGIA